MKCRNPECENEGTIFYNARGNKLKYPFCNECYEKSIREPINFRFPEKLKSLDEPKDPVEKLGETL